MKFNVNGTEVEVGGGSGTSVIVCSKVKRGYEGEDSDYFCHAYIGISADFDVEQEGLTLGFAKRNRVKVGKDQYDNRSKTNGWHQIPQVPIVNGNRTPLFNPVFVSTTPSFTENGIAYYEVSFADGESFAEYIDNEGQDGCGYTRLQDEGQVEMANADLLYGAWGICLMLNGVRISPYATFKYNGSLWC